MKGTVSVDIRKLAKKSIDKADDTTVKMVLAMLEVKEKEDVAEYSLNEEEINRRFEEYESGAITPLSLEEFEEGIQAIRKKKVKSVK